VHRNGKQFSYGHTWKRCGQTENRKQL